MSTTEALWQEISIAALLGTQRRPYQPGAASGELGAILHAVPPSDGEQRLLQAAAATALHRRAGRLPVYGQVDLPPVCPPDDWPRCSALSAQHLDQILNSGKNDLLQEWVELAASHKQRVREEQLPDLLDRQKTILPLRQALLPVIGQRGQWLAGQNPDWNAFVRYTDERWWYEGQRKERIAFLSDLRASDPGRARELLAATWAEEPPAERLAFLQILADGISMADEPFLEAALDDRRKDVRQAAAQQLGSLPESRLVQRMTARARRMLIWRSNLLRSSLEVRLPERCDAEMLRDGIDPNPAPIPGCGEKAGWLVQILAFVPPRTWAAAWNRPSLQILNTLRKHEFEEPLLRGLKEAAARCQDTEWLEALIVHESRRDMVKLAMDLFPNLPNPAKERLTLSLLNDNPSLSYEQTCAICLAACRHPWSVELTQAVTQAICQTLRKGDFQPWRWEKLLRDIPPYFHPDRLGAAVERMTTALNRSEAHNPPVSTLLSMLEFRLEMRKAFVSHR